MSIWWVNTGARFKAQINSSSLWCPNLTPKKDGSFSAAQWHWSIIQDVRPGEFILVARDGFIEGIAIAQQSAIPKSAKPITFPTKDNWHNEGWLLPIAYVGFPKRISRSSLVEGLFRYKTHRSPFHINKNGALEGNQVYFAELPGADAAEFFDRVSFALELQRPGALENFLAMRNQDTREGVLKPSVTMREAIRNARIGQGQFRKDLLEKWNGKCAATGLNETKLLRASHIVPWASATDEERINPFNGLLLSAAYDAAFDTHLIALSSEGKWENVAGLSADALKKAGLGNIEQQSVVGLEDEHHKFIERHRQNAYEKWAAS